MDLLRKFLNLLSPSQSMVDQEMLAQENTEYQVCFFSPIKTGFLEGAGEGGGGFGASKDLQSISNKCYCLEISTLYRTEVANFINVFLKIVFTNDIITMAYHRNHVFTTFLYISLE